MEVDIPSEPVDRVSLARGFTYQIEMYSDGLTASRWAFLGRIYSINECIEQST